MSKFIQFQTYETPLHYVSRHGNDEILLEMLKNLHPDKEQSSVNRQDKVGFIGTCILISGKK